ncbi:MAG: efflux RND transporter periplasmic adaptor subunit [Methylacidiphilales bacterium]|nr:efflux RND transporter periplasmic adaptor subunit [Candidatus Methylacidiphilales bacterium]
MKKNFTLLVTLVVIALVGGAVALWATGVVSIPNPAARQPVAGAAPPPMPVSVARVLEKSVTEWDDFSGRIQAIDRVEIRPQVSGPIVAIHFADGQLVKKGDLLFTIDPRPFQADLSRAEAVLEGAQAHVALAQINLDRNKQLIASHAIAQSDLDQTNDTFLEADAGMKAAQAAVDTARLNLEYTSITAPVTGRVSRAEVTVGNLVGAGVTAPVLTTIVSVSPVYVEFEIDEQAYLKYAANGASGNTGIDHIPVSIGLANEEGYPHQGHLDSIDNELDTTSGTIRVRAVFDNASGELTPGLYAKVHIGGSTAESAILVDDRAVGTDQDKKYVMVVGDDNKATYRTVTLGPIVNGLRVIRSGLHKDERIVVNGLQRVRPNEIVAPMEIAMDRNSGGKGVSGLVTASAK